MSSISTAAFYKRVTCPSSETLLSYHEAELNSEQMTETREHLQECDFCCAELQLLTQYAAPVEECSVTVMPAHLRRLAEALLTKDSILIETSAPTPYEKEPLTLTDA